MTNRYEFLERINFNPPDINEIIRRIKTSLQIYYNIDVKDDYKSHFSEEFQALRNYFPNVDFAYEGRIKNQNSLDEKIDRKLSQGKTGNIYDIFANKIILYSVNGCTDEETLINACYEIADFLNAYSTSLTRIPNKCKDYISRPKENGYQALHVLRNHSTGVVPNYCSETQIRTFRMEEYQKFGTASHMISYKPSETLRPDLCPIFLEIGRNGKTYELSPKDSFKKYKDDYEVLQDYFNSQKQK